MIRPIYILAAITLAPTAAALAYALASALFLN